VPPSVFAYASGHRTLWRLKRCKSRVACVLRQRPDRTFRLAVTIDGNEIAARRYRTQAAAIGDASFLLERLAADGWTLVVGMSETTLH